MLPLIKNPSGIIPKLTAENLPDNAAQTCENATITGGALVPLETSGTAITMYSGSELKTELPPSDVVTIAKPATPTQYSLTGTSKWMVGGLGWLTLNAYAFARYVDSTDGLIDELADKSWLDLSIDSISHHGGQMIIESHWPGSSSWGLDPDVTYEISGPHFTLDFTASPTTGGPETAITIPPSVEHGSPRLPGASVALLYENRRYAAMQAVDYYGPSWDTTIFYPSSVYATTSTYRLKGTLEEASFQIVFDMNYERKQEVYRFISSYVDSSDREGPQSETSEEIIVAPGERLMVTLPASSTLKRRLYRTVQGQTQYFRVGTFEAADLDSNRWEDTGEAVEAAFTLPVNGNAMELTTTGASLTAFKGRIKHPAGFGISYYNSGGVGILSKSDYFKYHVWPNDYTQEFPDEIRAIAMAGGACIIWTGESTSPYDGKVYSDSGSSPASAAARFLSENHPLIAATGVCRIGDSLFYVTKNGLAEVNSGGVRIVTEEFFTQEAWWDFWGDLAGLADISASVLDDAIYLENSAKKLRLDLTEGAKALTTWTGSTSTAGKTITWKSKKFRFDRKQTFAGARVVLSSGTATLKVYADGALADTFTLTSGKYTRLPNLAHAESGEFQLETTATVFSCDLYERKVNVVEGNQIALTAADVDLWEDFHVRMPGFETPVAGYLQARGGTSFKVSFYDPNPAGADTALLTVNVPSEGPFQIAGLAPKDLYRISISASGDTDPAYAANNVEALKLYLLRTETVQGVLRETFSGGVPKWWYTRYQFAGPAVPKSLEVDASQNVTMRAWYDAADRTGSKDINQSVANAEGGIRLAGTAGASSILVDFNGNDRYVREWILRTQEIQPIGGTPITFGATRGNLFRFDDRGTIAAVSFLANQFTANSAFYLYKDSSDTAWYGDTLNDYGRYMFPFPRNKRVEGAVWEADMDAADDDGVQAVKLWPQQVNQGAAEGITITQPDPFAPPWLFTDWKAPEGMSWDFASGRIVADDSAFPLTWNLYKNGSTTVSKPITVTSAAEFRISEFAGVTRIGMDFGGNDHKVQGIQLNNREIVPVGVDGLVLAGRRSYRNVRLEVPQNASLSVLKLMSSGTSATLRVYDVDAATYFPAQAITVGTDVRLGANLTGKKRFDIDLDYGTDEVYALHLIGRVVQDVNGGTVSIPRAADPFTYLDRRVRFSRPTSLSAWRIISTDYPVKIKIRFFDGTQPWEGVANDETQQRFPFFGPKREYGIDIIEPAGAMVTEAVFASSASGLRM